MDSQNGVCDGSTQHIIRILLANPCYEHELLLNCYFWVWPIKWKANTIEHNLKLPQFNALDFFSLLANKTLFWTTFMHKLMAVIVVRVSTATAAIMTEKSCRALMHSLKGHHHHHKHNSRAHLLSFIAIVCVRRARSMAGAPNGEYVFMIFTW